MKKRVQIVLAVMLMTAICLGMNSTSVLAAEAETQMNVSITLKGERPETNEQFVVTLTADDETYPMPEGAADGAYSISIDGEGSGSFPAIKYTTPEIYTYTIHQEPGKYENATYDKSVYHLTVYVTNAESGEGLEVTSVVNKDGETEKQSEVKFQNSYPSEEVKTGDDSNALFWLMIMVVSMVVVFDISRKKNMNK